MQAQSKTEKSNNETSSQVRAQAQHEQQVKVADQSTISPRRKVPVGYLNLAEDVNYNLSEWDKQMPIRAPLQVTYNSH